MELLRDLTKQKALADTLDSIVLKMLGPFPLEEYPSAYQKGAVAATTTGDLSGMIAFNQPLLDAVRLVELRGRLANAMVNAPAGVPVPVPASDEIDVTWGENSFARLVHVTTSEHATLRTHYAVIAGLTREAVRRGDPKALTLLLNFLVPFLATIDDRAFLDGAATSDTPGGILEGVTPSGSGSPATVADAVETAAAEVSDGDPIAPRFIASARGAMYLAAQDSNLFRDVKLQNGTIAGVPLLISRAAAERLILLDAAYIANSDFGLEIQRSDEAAVHMDDAPSAAQPLVSAFQTNTTFLKFTRFCSWKRLRSDAAAFIELPVGGSPN